MQDQAPTCDGALQAHGNGAGSYSDTINPASYKCVEDYGAWLYNAGVIPFTNLGTCDNVANANPVKRLPQLGGDAAQMHTMTHRWWGSLSFIGEMRTGDANGAAYITPDPFIARISERGLRVMGIPTGLSAGPVALVTPFLTRSPRCLTVQRSATQRTATWTRSCTTTPKVP